MRSHRRLFSLKEECYLEAGRGITESILLSVGESVVSLHVVTGWVDMLRVALWTSRKPLPSDICALLGDDLTSPEGLNDGQQDIDEIFRGLCDEGRLDVFRAICKTAKRTAESKIGREKLLVHCHLVGDEAAGILASSL